MRKTARTALAALLVTLGGATASAQADDALDKLLHEALDPDDTLTAKAARSFSLQQTYWKEAYPSRLTLPAESQA